MEKSKGNDKTGEERNETKKCATLLNLSLSHSRDEHDPSTQSIMNIFRMALSVRCL
jgi:hypothetical protein